VSVTLEELLRDGKVETALILRGDYTPRELELIRRAFEAGVKLGKEAAAVRVEER
jgi:hypothetical protein